MTDEEDYYFRPLVHDVESCSDLLFTADAAQNSIDKALKAGYNVYAFDEDHIEVYEWIAKEFK